VAALVGALGKAAAWGLPDLIRFFTHLLFSRRRCGWMAGYLAIVGTWFLMFEAVRLRSFAPSICSTFS